MVALALEAVQVRLGGRDAIRGVDAVLSGGLLTGVIGPNGAGKSTLMRASLGLLPLAGGRVLLDGVPLAGLSPRQLARRLAYLPQGQTLHWPLAVERLVALGRLPHLAPFSKLGDEDMAAIEAAMARADVTAFRHRNALELSGGERARVMLARTLAIGADALIVDEPLASLDPGHQLEVMELLRAEARNGAMVIAVLHDLALAARYCDRLLLMNDGHLVADGRPAEVLRAERLAAVYGIDAFMADDDGVLLVVPRRRSCRAGRESPRNDS